MVETLFKEQVAQYGYPDHPYRAAHLIKVRNNNSTIVLEATEELWLSIVEGGSYTFTVYQHREKANYTHLLITKAIPRP